MNSLSEGLAMTDTDTWMREYERRRKDLVRAADAYGFACASIAATTAERRARHEEMEGAQAELDAHVRGLVEENERLRELLRDADRSYFTGPERS